MIVRRVGVWSLAKIYGALCLGMGLIFGVFFGLFSLLGMGMATMAADESGAAGAIASLFFGVGAVIFMPLFYGLMGLVIGAVSAVIYNLAARLVGGLELHLEPAPEPSPSPQNSASP